MSIRSLTHLHSLLLYHHITIAPAIILWLPTACHDQLHSLYSAVHILSSAPTSISPSPSLSVSFSPSVHEMLMHASEGRQVQGAYFIYFITISSMIIIIIFSVTGGAAAIRERDRERGRQEQSRGKQSPTINQRMNLNLQCVPNNNNNIWFMYVASSAVGRVLK